MTYDYEDSHDVLSRRQHAARAAGWSNGDDDFFPQVEPARTGRPRRAAARFRTPQPPRSIRRRRLLRRGSLVALMMVAVTFGWYLWT